MPPEKSELQRLYHEKGLTQEEIGERFDVTKQSVYQWMKKYDIETRSQKQAASMSHGHPSLRHDDNGYEKFNGGGSHVLHHRLLGVAMFGHDAVVGNHIHHINELKWDTRPGNIELVDPSNRASLHHKETCFTDDLLMMELYHNKNMTQSKIAELFGINQSEVSRRVA